MHTLGSACAELSARAALTNFDICVGYTCTIQQPGPKLGAYSYHAEVAVD